MEKEGEMPSKQTIERLKKKWELSEFYREVIANELWQANHFIQGLQNRMGRMDRKRLEKQNDVMRHLAKVSVLAKPYNMKAMRKNAELSIGDVHNETGISKSVISRIENGETKKPSWDTLFKLILFYESHEQQILKIECKTTRIQKAIIDPRRQRNYALDRYQI